MSDRQEVARARALVSAVAPVAPEQTAARAATLGLLDTTEDPLGRQGGGHLTGSALVVDAAGERVLVLWHQKLRIWVQPGGHVDGDGDLGRSALREAAEETGIDGLRLAFPLPIDLDVHRVAPPDADPHDHHDVRFVVLAPAGAEPVANAEADRFRWLRLEEVEADPGCDASLRRLARLGLAAARGIREALTPPLPSAAMATVVFLHAHPDDECLTTGGTMARLASEGHRVVLVTATDGSLGEVPEGLLADGEDLATRRAREVRASAAALGVAEHRFLGYGDSGMAGTDGNAAPGAFCNADVEEAAARLARVLEEETADVLVTYDANGGYGHPDHIQVHHVGIRAADLAGTPGLYQVTINRDLMVRLLDQSGELDAGTDEERAQRRELVATLGLPLAEIDTVVDVSASVPAKVAAMRCHETQVGDMRYFLEMPVEAFTAAFGVEWFVRMRAPEGTPADHLVPAGEARGAARGSVG